MTTKRKILADHLETIKACPACGSAQRQFERFEEFMGFVAEAVFDCGGRVQVSSEAEYCYHVAQGCPRALEVAMGEAAGEICDELEDAE